MLSTSSSTTIIVHHPDHPDLVCTAHNLGKHFKAQLVRGRGCLFCGIKVGAPARHCAQCTVLFQLTIAVAYCQDGRHGGLQKLAEDLFTACFPSGGAPALHSPAQPPTTPLVPAANKRQRSDQAQKPFGRRHPKFQSYQARSHQGTPFQATTPFQLQPSHQVQLHPEALNLVTRMLLRHEDAINLAALDRGLVGFIKQDRHSILPSMLQEAKVWKESAPDSQEKAQPLRTVLISCLVRELLQRLQTVPATAEGRGTATKMGLLTDDGWVYQKWCRKDKKLVTDTSRQPMTHDNAVRTLNALKDGLTGDVIQQFKATQGLEEIEATGQQSATFLLQVSLRGTTAASP